MQKILYELLIDTPTASPEGVQATLTQDKMSITVNWDYKTLSEVGSFFIYKVTATPVTNRKRQSGGQIERTVPYNVTSVTLTGADPNINYQITVSYVTYGPNGTEIAGPASNPVMPINAVTSSSSSVQSTSSSIITTSSSYASSNTPTLSETDSTSNTGKHYDMMHMYIHTIMH